MSHDLSEPNIIVALDEIQRELGQMLDIMKPHTPMKHTFVFTLKDQMTEPTFNIKEVDIF